MQSPKWKGMLVACLLLAACTGGLSPSLKQQISAEAERLSGSRRQVASAQAVVDGDLARNRQLFENVAAPEVWKTNLKDAARDIEDASRSDRTLEELARQNRADSAPRVERLLADERRLRTAAVTEAHAAQAEADKWVEFSASLPARLTELGREYDSIRAADLGSTATVVEKAEVDWPAKKPFLQSRLAELNEIPAQAAKEWNASETARSHAGAGSAAGPDVATLIQTNEALRDDDTKLHADAEKLRALSGQLYESWDKILIDLDVSNFENDRLFRERIKTIRTHVDEPGANGTTTSAEQWITVSEPEFRNVEHDLGMAIAHKDLGLFDFEAQRLPQPAGFAYIATEQQGSNRYGYWAHDNGVSVWHWLPEYLILRELLWNHDYRPVVLDEYRGYQVARGAGRSFYGQTTPAAPPKYGTGGTYTATHYAGSRYVQSGGYKGSVYASNSVNHTPFKAAEPGQRTPLFSGKDSAGKRFGFGAGGPSGRRFGGGSLGRRFGGRR